MNISAGSTCEKNRALAILRLLFFLSGASSLIFETIFSRLLTYTFGNTAYAVSTVLASFLGGLALGAFVLGRWLDRRAPSLRFYGGLELLIGVYCLFIPSLFGWLTESYVALYYRLQLGTAGLTTLRAGLSAVLILVPSFLMGGTLPAIARFLAARRSDFQSELDRFYALNTLGAASGVLISTYALIPVFGIRGTIAIASSINILIAIASNMRALSQGAVFSKSEEQESRASLHQTHGNYAACCFRHTALVIVPDRSCGSWLRGGVDPRSWFSCGQYGLRVWADAIYRSRRIRPRRAHRGQSSKQPFAVVARLDRISGRFGPDSVHKPSFVAAHSGSFRARCLRSVQSRSFGHGSAGDGANHLCFFA